MRTANDKVADPVPVKPAPRSEGFAQSVVGPVLAACTRLLMWLLLHLCTRPTFYWKGCAQRGPQRIYFANHQSHFDWLLIRYAVAADVRDLVQPVVAAEYWSSSRFKRFLTQTVFKTVPLSRSIGGDDPDPLGGPSEALRGGVTLILFPEGTRGSGGDPAAFKAGLFHLAQQHPRAQLIPVWIEGTHRVMPKGTSIPRSVSCSATFGAPLAVDRCASKQFFLDQARDAVLSLRPVKTDNR